MYYNKADQLRAELVPTQLSGLKNRELVANPKKREEERLEIHQYFKGRKFILETLKPREARMFSMYYGLEDGKFITLEQIAEDYDLTRSRVGQIVHKALRRLRKPSTISILKYLTDAEVGYTGKGYQCMKDVSDEELFNDETEEMDDTQLESVEEFDAYNNFREKLNDLVFAKKNRIMNARLESLTDEQKQAKLILDVLLSRPCDLYTKPMERDFYGAMSANFFQYRSWDGVLDMDVDDLKSKRYQDFIDKIHACGLYFKREFKYIEDWENAIYSSFIEKGLDNVRDAFNIPKIDSKNALAISVLLETPIEDLNLSVRAYNCLKRAGMDTLGEVVCKTEADLIRVRNLGRKTMKEIIDKVRSLGLDIRTEEESAEDRIEQLKQKLDFKPTFQVNPKHEPQVKLDINEVPEAYRATYAIGAGVVAGREAAKDAQSRLIVKAISDLTQSKFTPRVRCGETVRYDEAITDEAEQLTKKPKGGRLIAEQIALHHKEMQDARDEELLSIIEEDISVIWSLDESFIAKHKDALIQIILKDKNLDADQRLKLYDVVYNTRIAGVDSGSETTGVV